MSEKKDDSNKDNIENEQGEEDKKEENEEQNKENIIEENENNKIENEGKNILKEKINQKEIEEKEEQKEEIDIQNQEIEENPKEQNNIISLNVDNSRNLQENKKFEENIMDAYKKLSKIQNIELTQSTENEEEEEEEDDEEEIQMNLSLQYCEKKLRLALNICQNDPNMIINRNIIDKLNRITLNNKINLNYIIGDIYICLMNKESLFDYDDKAFEVNDLMMFINKVAQFKELEIMHNTNLGIKYIDSLTKFLTYVSEQFNLEDHQLNSIYEILYNNKEIDHTKLSKEPFKYFLDSLYKELETQPNIYEQYKIFLQNKDYILFFIEKCDENNPNDYDDFLKLGKCFINLFFNKEFSLYLANSNEKDIDGERHLIFDGNENKEKIKVINGKKFHIYNGDELINELREELCEMILKYIEKFIVIIDSFQIQYLIYVLIKRIYFSHYMQYKKKVENLLVDSLINMCFFKESPLKIISNFINKILKSTREEELELKNILIENIRMAQKEEGFLYKIPKFFSKFEIKNNNNLIEDEKKEEEKIEEEEEETEEEDDISEKDKGYGVIIDEIMLMYHNDLNIGFLNHQIINSGEKFIFYEALNEDFSVLDFCLKIQDYDIKITITDLTEDRIIYSNERLNSAYESPLKLIMLFTTPRILKFEFDNTYSWLRKKIIRYKANIFYPKNPYSISHKILIDKYKNKILKCKNKNNKKKKIVKNKKKVFVDESDKILILKIDGENKVLNCMNVKQNLDAINRLVQDKYLYASSIFIKVKNEGNEHNLDNKDINDDKSYFYYYKENEGLIETELTKESIDNYLSNLLTKSSGKLNIINLYVINGDFYDNDNIYSLKKILGFDPLIKVEGNLQKILFFVQNLSQAQLLYYLYQQVYNQNPIDILLLINYTKYGGFQIILFFNDEIMSNPEDFKGLNKNETIDNNVKIICDGIKKVNRDERKIDVVLTVSVDDKENEITCEKLEGKILENLENYKKNIRVIKTDLEFNIDLQINSHIFYLDN